VTLGLTLAFEPTEPGTMHRPPRRPDQPILSGELLWRVIFVSVLVVCGGFGVFYLAEARGQSVEAARTHVVNAIVAMEIFYLFNVRFAHGQSLTLRGAIGTPAVLAGVGIVVLAQLAITYAPFMNLIFGTQPASLLDMLIVVGVGLALFVLVEIEKAIRRHLRERSAPRAA
jgi:magnesium-transporting ATPase (P-type)